MTTPFTQRLRQGAGQGGISLWLKSSAYTRQLLQGSADADVWQSAASYLAWFSQAHGLLKPDVAVVEVGDLYNAWVAREGGLESRLGKRRNATMALRRLLEDDAPKALLAEILEAVASHLRSQVPIVLAMPSPRHWLRHANRLANQPDDAPDADTVEDASVYLADLLRSVSAKEVAGVLLEEAADDNNLNSEDLLRYRTLANITQHYRWALALRVPPGVTVPKSGPEIFQAVIADNVLSPDTTADTSIGIDASADFANASATPSLQSAQFHFVEIAPGLQPETVLDTLKTWRQRS